jgi:hypothetical protein
MNRGVGAFGASKDFCRSICQHFVGIHVVRGAGSGLVHIDDELIAQLAFENFVGGRDDRLSDIGGQPAKARIRCSRGLLHEDRRLDELVRRAKATDREIFGGPLRLNAVVRAGGHVVFTQRIAFDAVHDGRSLSILPACSLRFSTAYWTSSSRHRPTSRRTCGRL